MTKYDLISRIMNRIVKPEMVELFESIGLIKDYWCWNEAKLKELNKRVLYDIFNFMTMPMKDLRDD